MTRPSEHERKAFDIFLAALDIDTEAREAFIVERSHGDPDLVAEVRALLIAERDATDGGFLSKPSARVELVDESFGEFRIVKELARGGMGTVYEAEQERPRRRVALKVLDPALCHGTVLRRFEVEAEVLAHLEHSSIARVIASGVRVIETGGLRIELPWLAMELLVDARPVTQYVAERSLSLREKLELFRAIGAAVEHAHLHGIIHRDIKPGNVLVGKDGNPKLIDFGIAHRTGGTDPGASRRTVRGEILGTLRYMAPEQFRGEPGAVDARTDVYALGVMLCEMLTGKPPLDPSNVEFHEAAQMVAREAPVPPSRLAEGIPREIDAVVLKALEKQPSARYASVAQLDEDVRRFLENEPVLASPPSRLRNLLLFVRRHRLAVASAMAIFLALVVGLIGTFLALGRAREAERQARDEAAISSRFLSLFKSAFQRARPDKQGADLKVVDILDLLAERDGALIPERPQASADLSNQISVLYATLGVVDKAQSILEGALELLETNDEVESRVGVGILQNLAELRSRSSKFDQAARDLARASEIAARVLENDDSMHADLLHRRGALQLRMKEYTAAEPLFRSAVARRESTFGRDHLDTLASMNSLNVVLQELGKWEESEDLSREVVERMTALAGPDNPSTLMVRNNLAALYADRGKFSEAKLEFERILTAQRKKLPADHPDILLSLQNLAHNRVRTGEVEAGLREMREVATAYERKFGIEDARTIAVYQSLTDLLTTVGRGDQALEVGGEVLTRLLAMGPSAARAIGGMRVGLANVHYKLERFDEAAREAVSAHEILISAAGEDASETKRALRLRESAEKASKERSEPKASPGQSTAEKP